jgi:RNA polymerase sigma-70 factor, ECF subfamily
MSNGGSTNRAKGFAPEQAAERAEEAKLLAAARRGDRQALGRLLERVSAPTLRFSRRFCRDPDDAEDLVQEVLAALMSSLRTFRGKSSLSTWAYVVAMRACARLRKRQTRLSPLETLPAARELPADAAEQPELRFERKRLGEALERAIGELPRVQREALLLRDVEGLSAAEAGRVLGLGDRAVKSRLHRARVALRERLAPLVASHLAARRGRRRAPGCPDTVRLLSRHLEGELSATTCARMEAHVASCAKCEDACRSLRAVLGACRAHGDQPIPMQLRRAVRAAIRRAVRERGA